MRTPFSLAAYLVALFMCWGIPNAHADDNQFGPYRKKWVIQTQQIINSMAFSPDGKILATGGHGAFLWDVEKGELIREIKARYKASSIFCFTPDGKNLVTEPVGGKPANAVAYGFSIIDLENDNVTDIESPYGTRAESVALSPSGDVAIALFSPWEKGRLAVYDTKTWAVIRMFAPDRSIKSVMAVSPDNKHVAVAKYTGFIQIWNYRTGELEREFATDHKGGVDSLAYSPGGNLLASGGGTFGKVEPVSKKLVELSEPDLIRVWDVASGSMQTSYPLNYGISSGEKKAPVTSIVFVDGTSLLGAYGWGAYLINVLQEVNDNTLTAARTVASCCGGKLLVMSGTPDRVRPASQLVFWERAE